MADDLNRREVVKGLNLVMQLEDPAKLIELMQKIGADAVKGRIRRTLTALDYVHFARFLPLWDRGLLLVITEFDGDMHDYVMDFAAVLDAEFSLILSYMKDAPRLPVSRYPAEFWSYVQRNTRMNEQLTYPEPFSPYIDKTVLDLIGAGRVKSLPAAAEICRRPVELADVQGNVLLGYRAHQAVYLGLCFDTAQSGRALIGALGSSDETRVTPAAPWPYTSGHCINLGLTHAGLQALGLPADMLVRFPQAFREGPRLRASRLGDEGDNAPEHWRIGGVDASGEPAQVHAVVWLHVKAGGDLERPLAALRALCAAHGAHEAFEQRAETLDAQGTVHFGYRDGLSQPRIAGVHPEPGRQGFMEPGDFLLGVDRVNSRGGNYIGELPASLAQNATYAAMRVIEQYTDRFESMLSEVAQRHRIDRELVAAKLMGRWRDGTPLVMQPQSAAAGACGAGAGATAQDLDDFDYVDSPDTGADGLGLRCPLGAHTRRLNPRGGLVVGVPWGRRVIRRGMTYGRAGESKECGLVGLFLCGDLESQFEFLQGVWANKDLSSMGIRGTKDPFISRTASTSFRFRPSEDASEISIEVPPLTRTVGSLYLLMPGIRAVDWIARAGWTHDSSVEATSTDVHSASAAALSVDRFDPTDPGFRANPYPWYAAFRTVAPVFQMKSFGASHWVFSHALVREVCERHDVFLKPGKDRAEGARPFSLAARLGDGLFFMDPPRHSEVRAIMNDVFAAAIAGAGAFARQLAGQLIEAARRKGKFDLVGEFASVLPMRVFMGVMGIPATDQGISDAFVVDRWTRAALKAHDGQAHPADKLAGATATMALRSYFFALARDCPAARAPGGHPSVIGGMALRTACPASADSMHPDEAMNTAVHFALGGYLSTEFLITTGIYNLLRHPDQWNALRCDRSLLPQAVHEMLRYDAPFQIADRWVGTACTLGNVRLEPGAKLAVVYGSANRDDRVFPDPDRFDITRPITNDNFGFGHRVHQCIGQALALEVTQAALSALLDAAPMPRIGDLGPWIADPYFRSRTAVTLLLD